MSRSLLTAVSGGSVHSSYATSALRSRLPDLDSDENARDHDGRVVGGSVLGRPTVPNHNYRAASLFMQVKVPIVAMQTFARTESSEGTVNYRRNRGCCCRA